MFAGITVVPKVTKDGQPYVEVVVAGTPGQDQRFTVDAEGAEITFMGDNISLAEARSADAVSG